MANARNAVTTLVNMMAKIWIVASAPGSVIAVLAVFGMLGWIFLSAPYLISANRCPGPTFSAPLNVECLKPVARQLRADSNIAAYATATIATVIAVQLGRRSHEQSPGGTGIASNGDRQGQTGLASSETGH